MRLNGTGKHPRHYITLKYCLRFAIDFSVISSNTKKNIFKNLYSAKSLAAILNQEAQQELYYLRTMTFLN